MKTDNIIQKKTFAFAINIINIYKVLQMQKKEFLLSKQLLKSGTSVGANIEEMIGAQSGRDFFSKLSIAYKEARESLYWLKLLEATEYLSVEEVKPLKIEAEEISRIIGKIQISYKKRNPTIA
jgi:four helix bundle protein